MRYTLHGQTLKEDLILANAAARSHAALRLPDTYDYEAMDDGSVSVRDKVTGECYYVFEAPYVYDAENAEIPATVVLTPVSDGVRMHYELDEEALAQAAFPVTIDPLIRSANANKYTEFSCLADGQSLPYSQSQDHIKLGSYNGKQCVGIRTSSGDRKIPLVASHGTASWVEEEGTIPESDDAFGQITIGAHKIASMIKVSDAIPSCALTRRRIPCKTRWTTRGR